MTDQELAEFIEKHNGSASIVPALLELERRDDRDARMALIGKPADASSLPLGEPEPG